MEFDKSRVYTALNADELKVGSKVICADNIFILRLKVIDDEQPAMLTEVFDESTAYRFQLEADEHYALAYLVSEPEEKKLKWTDLKVGDILLKKNNTLRLMVTVTAIDYSTVSCLHIYAGPKWISDEELEAWEKVE